MFNCAGKVGHSLHQFPQAFFDALGDDDFTFACQQLDGTHLTHIHADWVGGAASFVLDSGKCGGSFRGGNFVCT